MNLGNNLLLAYLRAERFADLYAYAKALPASAENSRPYLVAALGAWKGAESAVEEASRLAADSADRSSLLVQASDPILRVRRYELAAELLRRAAEGSDKAGSVGTRAQMVAKIRRAEDIALVRDPSAPARRYVAMFFEPVDRLEKTLSEIWSKPNLQPESFRESVNQMQAGLRLLHRSLEGKEYPLPVMRDMTASWSQFSWEGDDLRGYRVRATLPGGGNATLLVIKEDGEYKLLWDSDGQGNLGREVLARIGSGDLATSKALLDWAREVQQPAGGDDPLVGPLLPRFWSKSSPADATAMREAAAALLSYKTAARVAIPILEDGLSRTQGPERTRFLLALDASYHAEGLSQKRLVVARELHQVAPDSDTAHQLLFRALVAARRPEEALELARGLRQEKPDEVAPVRLVVTALTELGRWSEAAAEYRAVFDAGKATPADYNSLAWQALFRGAGITDQDIDLAQKGVTETQRQSAAVLHTLAALYAEVGKISEARETLDQALDTYGVDEPNSVCWYVLGRIAEQCGDVGTAKARYSKMDGEGDDLGAVSTMRLAAARMKAIESGAHR